MQVTTMIVLFATALFRGVYAAVAPSQQVRRSRIASAVALGALAVLTATNTPGVHAAGNTALPLRDLTLIQQGTVLTGATAGAVLMVSLGRDEGVRSRSQIRWLISGGVVAAMIGGVFFVGDRSDVAGVRHIYEYTFMRARDAPFVLGLIVVQLYSGVLAAFSGALAGRRAGLVQGVGAVSLRLLQAACLVLAFYAGTRVMLLGRAGLGWISDGSLQRGLEMLSVVAVFAVVLLCSAFIAGPAATRVLAAVRLVRQRALFEDAMEVVPQLRPDRRVGGWSLQSAADARATAVFDVLAVLLTHPGVGSDPDGGAHRFGGPETRAEAVAGWLDSGLVRPVPLELLSVPAEMSSSQWLQEIIDARRSSRSPFEKQARSSRKVAHG